MRHIWQAIAVIAALWAAPAGAQGLNALARIDAGASGIADAGGGGVDLRLALSQPVPYRLFLLDAPPRLVADFSEVDFGLSPPGEIDRAEAVAGVTWGRLRPGWSRMVLELAGPMRIVLADERRDAAGSADLIVRLEPVTQEDFAARTGEPVNPAWSLPEAESLVAPRARQTGERPLLVVLDPGHGGIDPGAEADGTTEAALMLTFARELADVLRRGGIDVLLTREEDVFVPLETRISVARVAGADLFLSLHADALEEGVATGATVYVLDEDAEEQAAALLAEKHDRADLLAGVDLTGNDDEVANVLMDLARVETEPRSQRLALALEQAISGAGLKMHRNPIQGAAFSVLKAPDIPSVLLEVGFLSSNKDRERIADPAWRAGMQGAILAALQAWGIADAAEARLIRQ